MVMIQRNSTLEIYILFSTHLSIFSHLFWDSFLLDLKDHMYMLLIISVTYHILSSYPK